MTVAMVFAICAVVCLFVAGSNYVDYRSGIAAEHERRFGQKTNPATQTGSATPVRLPTDERRNWERFKANRFRSVEQSLDLAAMCLVSGMVALVFWWSIGWLSVLMRSETRQRQS